MKSTIPSQIVSKVLEYTNKKLKNWYKNTLEDYGIIGQGFATLEESGTILIAFTESGVTNTYSVDFWQDENIDYVFEMWAENASIYAIN